MRIVKVFLASSIIEFEKERIYIGGFIRKLNDSMQDICQKVHLYLCEDEKDNSQSFYDRNIENSHIFIAILGEKIGEFTKHEINVADTCGSIKRKIIISTKQESTRLSHLNLSSDFEICFQEKDLKKSLVEILSKTIKDIVQSIEEEPEIKPLNAFIANIPDGDDTEVDVVNNIIRRLRDQNHNIIINDHFVGNENACIALLSNTLITESIRIKNLIHAKIDNYKLWLFAKSIFSHQQPYAKEYGLQELHDSIINKLSLYPSYYSSYTELSTDIEIKFRRFLDEYENNGTGFIYIIEEHWLIRKSLITSQKSLFINLCNIEGSPERKLRKERVILNLLNQYWMTGRMDKHVEAITKLLQGDYDSFIYSLDDLEEVKRREYRQAFFDYLSDILEQIQLKTIEHDTEWLEQELDYIINLLEERKYDLNPTDIFKVYFMIGNTYSIFPSLFNKAKNYYEKALSSINDLNGIEKSLLELTKYYILTLCMRLFEDQNSNEIYELAALGLKITNETDNFFYIAFKIIEYSSSVSNSMIQNNLEFEINQRLTPGFIQENNQNLSLAIIFFLNWVQIQYDKKPEGAEMYLYLINFYIDQYERYLSHETFYKIFHIALISKKALIANDYELIQSSLEEYTNLYKEKKQGKFYYDILYDKGIICLNKEMIDAAIEIFTFLSEAYNGKKDKGAALQSLALCFMKRFKEKQSLGKAEKAYKKALVFYENIEDNHMCGNVWDGLSYCYILQNEFQKAESSSLKALDICEYEVPNKHSNYISSLLCQGKFDKAKQYYLLLSDKDGVYGQLNKDWNTEMSAIGIDIKSFYSIFA